MTMLMIIQLHLANVGDFNTNQSIDQWNLHHNRKPTFVEIYRRRAIPENQAVEEILEPAVDGQADHADEAVVTSASVPGFAESDCHSNVSELE